MATIFGIPIRVDFSWVLIVALLTANLALSFGHDFSHLGLAARIAMGLAASFLLFASVLAHELAHAVVALRCGVGIRGITLFIFGGAAEMEDEPPDAASELKIAVAGPAMSLALAVGFLGIAILDGWISAPVGEVVQYLALMNAILVAFNIVPGFPLDGGRVLRALLWGIWGDLRLATRTASAVGSGFGLLITVLGFVAVFEPRSLFLGVWYIFIGLFLRLAARASYRHVLLRDSLKGFRVGELMGEPVSVSPAETLEHVAHSVFLASGLVEVPVVDEGKLLGIVRIQEVRRVNRDLWGYTRVAEIMEPDGLRHAVGLDEDASRLLVLTSGEDRVIPVVEGEELVGLVTSRDLMRRLALRAELGGVARLAGPGDQGDSESHEDNRHEDRE